MGQELRSLCQVETRKLLWLIGVMFAVIVTFQYIELPYGHVISSLFSAEKYPLANNGSLITDGPLSNSSEMFSNITLGIGLNSSDLEPSPNDNLNMSPRYDKAGAPGNSSSNEKDLPELEEANAPFSSSKESTGTAMISENRSSTSSAPLSNTLPPRDSSVSMTPLKNLSSYPIAPVLTVYSNTSSVAKGAQRTFLRNETSGPLSPAFPPNSLSINMGSGDNNDSQMTSPVIPAQINTTSTAKDAAPTSVKNENSGQSENSITTGDSSSMKDVPDLNNSNVALKSAVVTISEMNSLLHQSRASHRSVTPKWASAVDKELLYARSQIENAPIIKDDLTLYDPLYRNVSSFKRSYELMENMLKVYIYKEGRKPIMHQPVLKGIYASEGWFMKLLESSKTYSTKNSGKAHLFYLPFSSRMLEETLYVADSHDHKNLIQYLKDYLDLVSTKYSFWNRTNGADHFLVACHDWAPAETRKYMAKCIRALCNTDLKEGFVFGKDVSLPETNVRQPQKPLKSLGGLSASNRPILAFFAGKMHGYLRPILLKHWGDTKDPDMKIFGPMPKSKGKNKYVEYMKSSKYCICAKGYEVNSPRVVESIFYECVPVIISDNFVPPFFEVLNWESFAVFVLEKDIPNLKNILISIPNSRYLEMQMRVKKVQQHFLWHAKPLKYDIFHMILHSIWYKRVFQV